VTSVLDQLPEEGNEVRILGLFERERRGYYVLVAGLPVWWEAVDGPDDLIADVTHWERIAPPLSVREVR